MIQEIGAIEFYFMDMAVADSNDLTGYARKSMVMAIRALLR
jgi:hypothetical protein